MSNVKKGVSSTPLDPDDQGTSSCSPKEMQPNDSERASKLIDSVMSTLFSACTGNNCPTNDETLVESLQKKRPTKLGKKARSALHTLQHSSSRDECHYAQFYEDDHGVAARAVLLARKRETRERSLHRQKLQELHENARVEAQSEVLRGSNNISPQHREKIHVDGNPYRLSEVGNGNPLNQSNVSEDSESALSYNYDDGISAISAHTLEEMAKAELILQRKRGIPQEQGFDIALDSTKDSLPPSPASTVESSNASEDAAHIQDSVGLEEKGGKEDTSTSDSKSAQRYPVQMARPKSHRSMMSTGTSSQSEYMEWKNHDAKYWTQVVEDDNGEVESESKITSPLDDQHPHDTMSTLSSQKKKKGRKPRTPKIFSRRKKNYLTVNEHEI